MTAPRLPAAYQAVTGAMWSRANEAHVQSPLMAKKSSSQLEAERRAEARRRARLVAQGREVDDDDAEQSSEAARPRPASGSFLQRIFPPAAPLAGKPDPMAGFTATGRLRPLAVGAWLIRRNLMAGIGMGLLWAGAYILTLQERSTVIGSVASFVSFGSLVAAGWIGWQRPWFYGFVAAVVGYILYAIWVVFAISGDPLIATAAAKSQLATYLSLNGVLQAGIGALAGFYGGYLRRRLADPTVRQANAARRRR